MPQNPTADLQSATNEFATAGMEDAKLLEAAEEAGSRYAEARRKLREHWTVAKEDLSHFRQQAYDYSQSAAKATNAYAHDHPWRTAGAAVGVGALLGWLITRR
jgi:ElaB/YqjD/DUF883 family membrane-anchored ribosome-binding protein